jgi:hypothetical protein
LEITVSDKGGTDALEGPAVVGTKEVIARLHVVWVEVALSTSTGGSTILEVCKSIA